MAGQYAGFQSVKLNKPLRSSFDLSHERRLTTRMGKLTPILCQECVPSDSFRGSAEMLVRLAPLLAPIYDQIIVFVHFFFVPNRLLWSEWEEFITGGRLGVGVDPVTAPIPPFVNVGGMFLDGITNWGVGTTADHLGLPDFNSIDPVGPNWDDAEVDCMPFIAWALIWFEYYRDRNIIADTFFDGTPAAIPTTSGEKPAATAATWVQPFTRNYLHDYFTSALPFTQRGEEVLMPLAGSGSVTYLDQASIFTTDGSAYVGGTADVFLSNGIATTPVPPGIPVTGAGSVVNMVTSDGGAPGQNVGIANIDEVNITSSGVSINDFRSAYALQVWLERNAIGGSRYTESTQAHFGVKPQDSRLQRPEYIGGGRINVQISEVVATNWSNDGTADVPAGNLQGHGITYGNTNNFNYFCTEHGFIVGVLSIMNPPSYQQGLPKMFRRRSFLDYPWPTFAKLGEQPVNDFEIYCNPASLTPDPVDGEFSVFGYQSRYADWKYKCSSNHGDFKTTLLFWTLTRTFTDPPALSSSFSEFQDETQDRIFAVGGPDNDNFWIYLHNKITVKRPLPYFGTPNTMGFS